MDSNSKMIGMVDTSANLSNYEQIYQAFHWREVERNFSWSYTGKLNIVHEAIDRHVQCGNGGKMALHYKDEERTESYSYARLSELSNRFAHGLLSLGVKKGDRVFVFMPRLPELFISILGIVRIGAIAGALFEAFMEGAVKDRLADSEAIAVITTPALLSRIPVEVLPKLKHVILVGNKKRDKRTNHEIDFHDVLSPSTKPVIEWMERNDGMMLHYTSGSTGKPKGVLQSHEAMIHQYIAGKYAYDLKPDDVYWCTADPGWVTGTSAGIWSPWLNGVTVVVRGGGFNPSVWLSTLEEFKVNVWFSTPTAFRALMGRWDKKLKSYNLSYLRHVLSAGEPLNPEVIRWGAETIGLRIHDNWWMTETGSVICANYRCIPIRPGSMGKPLPGIRAAIVNEEGEEVPPYEIGNLAIRAPWPAMMREIWNNPEKYKEYFKNGWYISGDSAYMDQDGYFWFQGRVDDLINTAGKLIGPFEIESKLVEHPAVAEAGVIGVPHPIRGEIIKAFVTLREGFQPNEKLGKEIRQYVKQNLAEHAAPKQIEFTESLPKTRSSKIMRRVLKAMELGLPTGDLSTLET